MCVPAYDLLEDRRTKLFSVCFNVVESFDTLDNILRDWAKDKVQKKVLSSIDQVRLSRKKKKKAISLLENDSAKIL